MQTFGHWRNCNSTCFHFVPLAFPLRFGGTGEAYTVCLSYVGIVAGVLWNYDGRLLRADFGLEPILYYMTFGERIHNEAFPLYSCI